MNSESLNKVIKKHQVWRRYQQSDTTGLQTKYTCQKSVKMRYDKCSEKCWEKNLALGVKKTFLRYAQSKNQVKQGVAADPKTPDGTLTSNKLRKGWTTRRMEPQIT